jgi:Mrp family chromosome partitioning ATPase
MLRTQVLKDMDEQGWQFLVATSPTPGCGKTFTATNLAFSMGRQPERSVFLVDLDFRKPEVAQRLGLSTRLGLPDYLRGNAPIQDVLVRAEIRGSAAFVFPAPAAIGHSSEMIASRPMSAFIERLRREFKPSVVIFDMPSMLTADDVLALLPQIDCVLLAVAVGRSTMSEVEACKEHLGSANVVRVVLNRVREFAGREI